MFDGEVFSDEQAEHGKPDGCRVTTASSEFNIMRAV
jgi:hypothetical protein